MTKKEKKKKKILNYLFEYLSLTKKKRNICIATYNYLVDQLTFPGTLKKHHCNSIVLSPLNLSLWPNELDHSVHYVHNLLCISTPSSLFSWDQHSSRQGLTLRAPWMSYLHKYPKTSTVGNAHLVSVKFIRFTLM